MSDPQSDNFDDPGLKSAIGRVWGNENAPPILAERIRLAAQSSPRSLLQRSISPRWLIGMAAAVALVVGIGIYYSQFRKTSVPQVSVVPATQLATTLADQLVERHELCCAAADHHMPGLSRDDFPLIGKQLTTMLKFPALAANLNGNWTFHGASMCLVGPSQIHSGHLVFERGDRTFVSIFSLPRDFGSCHVADSGIQQMIDAKHPMAGFQTASGFYCIVGSSKDGSLSLDDVRAIRDQLRSDVALSGTPGNSVLAYGGELMHELPARVTGIEPSSR